MSEARKVKVLFCIQGEGRGHMTQSIALQGLLEKAGYEVCGVLLGRSGQREIPAFYYQRMHAPIVAFSSPNFLTDSKAKSIRLLPSIIYNLYKLPFFTKEMKRIHRQIQEWKPDLIINFYDPLIGLYYRFFKPGIPMICIAHQYIFHHPDFKFPPVSAIQKASLKNFTDITAPASCKRLALSTYPLREINKRNIALVPPLLREDIFTLDIQKGDYILIYLLNAGYMEEIIHWHEKHPEVKLHCFTDKKDMEESWQYSDTLCFHRLNDKKFLELMAGCKAFAGTAGFESVCEAMYMEKPVLMVPVAGHFEQFCNSRDFAAAGAGVYDYYFNLDKLLAYLDSHISDYRAYRQWVDTAGDIILKEISGVLPLINDNLITEPIATSAGDNR